MGALVFRESLRSCLQRIIEGGDGRRADPDIRSCEPRIDLPKNIGLAIFAPTGVNPHQTDHVGKAVHEPPLIRTRVDEFADAEIVIIIAGRGLPGKRFAPLVHDASTVDRVPDRRIGYGLRPMIP